MSSRTEPAGLLNRAQLNQPLALLELDNNGITYLQTMGEGELRASEAQQAWQNHLLIRELREKARTIRLAREARWAGGVALQSEHLQEGDPFCVVLQSSVDGVRVDEPRTLLGRRASHESGLLHVTYDTGWDFEPNYQDKYINLGSFTDHYEGVLMLPSFDKPILMGSFLQRGSTVAVDELGLRFLEPTTRYLPAQYAGVAFNGQRIL